MLSELRGREFDWFAQDSEGNFAMFATAGEGFVPDSILEHYSQHDSVSEFIPAPHVGSAKVWEDYTKQGLYVFDWSLPGGPYKLQGLPSNVMNKELRQKIMSLTSLPKFSDSFSKVSEIISCSMF